jgi:F-type H+-transporting ATPase subunit epsilon
MAGTIHLEIATPERLLVKEDATEVYIPAANGMIGILPEHAPLLSELGAGELSFVQPSGKHTVFVAGGWVQVLNNEVRVLADRAEDLHEIDIANAEADLKHAAEQLNAPASAGIDVAHALNAMRRAEARLNAARNK